MKKPKVIITQEMLANMEMFAVTNPGMRELLDQCKVFYELSGSPQFYEKNDSDGIDPSYLYDEEDLFGVSVCNVEAKCQASDITSRRSAAEYISEMWKD